jgi:polysaccharide pyruvyl transferase WcaK-like protein
MLDEPDVPIKQIAADLIDFQIDSGLQVLLTPVNNESHPWSDYRIMSKLHEASMGELTLLSNSLNFLEVATVLKGSRFFIGGSMHGAVTCLAYGKPAANILRWTAPKLQDLHGMRNRQDCFSNDWRTLKQLLKKLNSEAENGFGERNLYSRYMRSRLMQEINGLCMEILDYTERSE